MHMVFPPLHIPVPSAWNATPLQLGLLHSYSISFFPFPFGRVARGILIPRPATEPGLAALEAQVPNHWATREFPQFSKKIEKLSTLVFLDSQKSHRLCRDCP